MVWRVASRRGHVPYGPVVGVWDDWSDMRACAAWLLWSRRMDDPVLGGLPNHQLAEVARSRGIRLSTYDVTRAENGKGNIDPAVVSRYERLLGLPVAALAGPLRAAARLVPRAVGSRALLRTRTIEDTPIVRSRVVSQMYDLIQGGQTPTSGDWLQVADALTSTTEWLLPERVAVEWVEQLMDECMRSIDVAYHARSEALGTLAGDDRYAAHVVTAAKKLTSVPGAAGSLEAWSAVGDASSPAVIQSLIDDLPSVPDERFTFYGIALATPAQLGLLTRRQHEVIAAEIQRRLKDWSVGSFEPLAQLAAGLPADLSTPIMQHIDGVHPLARLTGVREGRDIQSEINYYTKAAMDATWPGHSGSVLPELLRIVLRNDGTGTRFHAATLIRWSPFTAAICDAATQVCLSDRPPATRQLAAYLASRLATPASEIRLRALLREATDPFAVDSALVGLAHAGVLTEHDDLNGLMKTPRYRGTAIYAAGITNHPSIDSADADSPQANWWRAKGGAVWQ